MPDRKIQRRQTFMGAVQKPGQGDLRQDEGGDSAREVEVEPKVRVWSLFRFAGPSEHFAMIFGSFLAIAAGLVFPMTSIMFGDSADAMAGEDDEKAAEAFAGVLVKFVVLVFSMGLLMCLWSTCWYWAAVRQSNNMRMQYLHAVLFKDISWFDMRDPAELQTRMAAEVQEMQDAIGIQTGMVFQCAARIVGGALVSMSAGGDSWKIGLVAYATGAPLLTLAGFYAAVHVKRATKVQMDASAKAGAVAEEVLMAMRTVASFGGELREVARYSKMLGPAKHTGLAVGGHLGLATGCLFFIFACIYAWVFWYGGELGPPGGTLTRVMFALIFGINACNEIWGPITKISTAAMAAQRMFKTIDTGIGIEAERALQLARARGSSVSACETDKDGGGAILEITFKNVHFCYPSRPDVQILRGLSLTISRGQSVAFVGESGSGKSTAIQLLERFYDPNAGVVRVNDLDLRAVSLQWWRRQIGYVGQEPVLFAMSVKRNIAGSNRSITNAEVVHAAKQAQAFEFLDRLPKKFDTFAGSGGGQMSGGQKQRIAIARALVTKPQVLLLDEATSALDNESEKQVQAVIDELQASASSSMTTISIAHRLSTIKKCTDIYFMAMGAVLEHGSHPELMAKEGAYCQLVRTQEAALADEEAEEPKGKFAWDQPADLHNFSGATQLQLPEASPRSAPCASTKPRSSAVPISVVPSALEALDELGMIKMPSRISTVSGWGAVVPMPSRQSTDSRKSAGVVPTMSRASKVIKISAVSAVSAVSESDHDRTLAMEMNDAEFKLPLGRLVRMSAPEWFAFPLAFLGLLMIGVGVPFQGFFLGRGIDDFFLKDEDEKAKALNNGALGFLIAGAALFLGYILKWVFLTFIQESLALRLRETTFRSLVTQEVGFFDDPSNAPAGLTTILEKQVKSTAAISGMAGGSLIGCTACIGTGLGLAFTGSWQVSLVLIGLCPIIGAGLSVTAMVIKGTASSGSTCAQAATISGEAIMNIRTVRALLAEQQCLDSFSAAVDRSTKKEGGWKVAAKIGFALGFCQSLPLFIPLIGCAVGAKFIDDGLITRSDLYQSMLCLLFGLLGVGWAMAYIGDATRGKLAAYDVLKLIDRESSVNAVEPRGLRIQDMGDGSITFTHVEFHYPHRPELPVLMGLSFKVTKGQTVALVGPSGSGKSTVIQLLMRFYDPSGGEVLIGGTPLPHLDISWWRRQVALVGQEPVLFNMSLEDNVRYGKPDASREEVEEVGEKAKMDFVFQGKLGWEDNVGLRGGKLSGGQKQRCAIARAMIRDPSVLLLDEATSALDSASEKEVQAALDSAKVGRTTFTIAHRLKLIQDSDVILVVAQGELAERGTHEELLELRGIYHTLAAKSA